MSLSSASLGAQKLSERVSLHLTASLDSVQLNLWKDGIKLVYGKAAGFSTNLMLYSSMRLVVDVIN
jgi:hypothetical protein